MTTQEDLDKLSEKFDKLLKTSLETMQESVHDQYQHTTKNIDAIGDAIEQLQPKGPLGPARATPTFNGDSDDPLNFLERFTMYSKLYKWDDEQSFLAFPLSLIGNAQMWYASLDKTAITDIKDIIKAFKAQFLSHTDHWVLRQELAQRRQGSRETLSNYGTDIRKRCLRLDIPPPEQLHFFINGLRPELRNYVILQQPKNLEEAERYAKIKNSVSDATMPASTAVEMLSLQREIIEQLKQKQAPIAAFNQQTSQNYQRPFRNASQPSTNYSFNPSQSNQALPTNHYPRPNLNSRSDFGRSIRTTQGHIVCWRCNRVGHHQRNCRAQMPRNFNPRPSLGARNFPRQSMGRNFQTFPVRSSSHTQQNRSNQSLN